MRKKKGHSRQTAKAPEKVKQFYSAYFDKETAKVSLMERIIQSRLQKDKEYFLKEIIWMALCQMPIITLFEISCKPPARDKGKYG